MNTFFISPGRAESAFWLILCSALAAGIGIETGWGEKLNLPPPATIETSTAVSDFAPPALAAPYRLPPPDTMLETSLRPLFVATRRPAPPSLPPEPPKPTMNKGQFKLSGVSIVPEGNLAFLVEKTSNRTHVVAQGKEINGILVKAISAERVELSQHGDSEVLMLQTAKGPASIPAAATAPGAQMESRAAPLRPQPAPQGAIVPPPPSSPARVTVGGTMGPN